MPTSSSTGSRAAQSHAPFSVAALVGLGQDKDPIPLNFTDKVPFGLLEMQEYKDTTLPDKESSSVVLNQKVEQLLKKKEQLQQDSLKNNSPDKKTVDDIAAGTTFQMVELVGRYVMTEDQPMTSQDKKLLDQAFNALSGGDRLLLQAATGWQLSKDNRFLDSDGKEVTPTPTQLRWIVHTVYSLAGGRCSGYQPFNDDDSQERWDNPLTPAQFRQVCQSWQENDDQSGRVVQQDFNQRALSYLNAAAKGDPVPTTSSWLKHQPDIKVGQSEIKKPLPINGQKA